MRKRTIAAFCWIGQVASSTDGGYDRPERREALRTHFEPKITKNNSNGFRINCRDGRERPGDPFQCSACLLRELGIVCRPVSPMWRPMLGILHCRWRLDPPYPKEHARDQVARPARRTPPASKPMRRERRN